jgi:hypothetical protein
MKLLNAMSAPRRRLVRNENEGLRAGHAQWRDTSKVSNGSIDTSRSRRTLRLEKDASGSNESGAVDKQAAQATVHELIEDNATRRIDVPKRLVAGNDGRGNHTAANQ